MRLTLRTLLAYLDEVLEPEDAQDLQRKIDSSQLAQGLIQRLEETLRRTPPSHISPAAGDDADANLVAEYLDSTLRPDLEPDFERNCLEVDIRLEEIAACHQILSMVVRERTPVSEQLRERIHALNAEFGWGHASAGGPPELLESRPRAWLHPPGSAPLEPIGPENSSAAWDTTADHGDAQFDPTIPTDRREERWRDDSTGPDRENVAHDMYEKSRHAGGFTSGEQPVAGTNNLAIPTLIVALLAIVLGTLAVRPELLSYLRPSGGTGLADGTEHGGDPLAAPTEAYVPDTGQPAPKSSALGKDGAVVGNSTESPASVDPTAALTTDTPGTSPPRNVADGREPGELAPSVSIQQPSRFQQDSSTKDRRTGADVASSEPAPPDPLVGRDAPTLPNPSDKLPVGFPEGSPTIVSDPANGGTGPPSPTVPPATGTNVATALPDASLADTAVPSTTPPTTTEPAAIEPVGPGIAPAAPTEIAAPPASLPEVVPPPRYRLNSLRDVVLFPQEAGPAWLRAATEKDLTLQTTYLVLPAFRSTVLVDRGMRLTFFGTSRWRFTPGDATDADCGLELMAGKVMIELEADQSSGHIAWRGNGMAGTLSLTGPGASVAILVSQVLSPGGDPSADLSASDGDAGLHVRRLTQLALTRGSAQIDAAGSTKPLSAESIWTIVDDAPGFETPKHTSPNWGDGSDVAPIDQQTSLEIEPFLPSGAAVFPVLRERATDKRVEQRSLAVRCLAVLGESRPAWESLSRVDQKAYWSRTVQTLREVLVENAEAARGVEAAVKDLRTGGDGLRMYRMLRGYSQTDLDRGADAELVNYLSHDSLDIRVLAMENLERITGRKGFRPEQSKMGRAPYVKQWQRELDDGRIRYTRSESPVPTPATAKIRDSTTR